jgi:hypothetical protein
MPFSEPFETLYKEVIKPVAEDQLGFEIVRVDEIQSPGIILDDIQFFSGPYLEATLESSEQGTDGQRIRVKGFRPITDAPTVYGSASYRETQQATVTAGTEILINSRTGRCDLNRSTRYSRYKVRIPASTTWSFVAGVEPDVTTEGKQ